MSKRYLSGGSVTAATTRTRDGRDVRTAPPDPAMGAAASQLS
jgi:hypothetical protein